MANINQRPRKDQYYRADDSDQARRDFRYEDEIEKFNDEGFVNEQRYPMSERDNYNDFPGNNEKYYGSARSGQWSRNTNRFDADKYNPNGGRFGHQGQRTLYDDNTINGASRRDEHFNSFSGGGRGNRSNNDLKRDFDRGMGYANYGSSEGSGDSLGFQDRERNRTGESSWFDADRKTKGLHKGKGPRGYQRSDERIKEDINDRLSDDPFVDATDIEVSVEKGDVTLSGNVEERHEKRKAEEIAESVSGVLNVENRIRVIRKADIGSSRDKNGNSNIGNGSSINGGIK